MEKINQKQDSKNSKSNNINEKNISTKNNKNSVKNDIIYDDGDIYCEDLDEEIYYESYGGVNKDSDGDFQKAIEFVETLQQIVIEEDFSQLRNQFFEKYYALFDNSKEENSLETHQVFQYYCDSIESYLTKQLNSRIKNFNMEKTLEFLITHKEEEFIDEELLEMLLSFSDFSIFKNMMIDFQANKENKFGLNIQVNALSEDQVFGLGNNNFNNNNNIELDLGALQIGTKDQSNTSKNNNEKKSEKEIKNSNNNINVNNIEVNNQAESNNPTGFSKTFKGYEDKKCK